MTPYRALQRLSENADILIGPNRKLTTKTQRHEKEIVKKA